MTITLSIRHGHWWARYSDPHVVRLMGTDCLPTSYIAASASAEEIIERFERFYPEAVVVVDNDSWLPIRQSTS